MSIRQFGAQLYTVRDHLQTEADFLATLHALKEMGYRGVHLSGIGGAVSRDAIIAGIKETGLLPILTHNSAESILHDTEKLIRYHEALGSRVIGLGIIPGETRDYDAYMRFFAEAAPAIEIIKQAGMVFTYHNHHFEFARHNGRTLMDYILDATDPEGVKICYDAYWAHYAGMDETRFILDHGDRVLVTHTKDMVTVDGAPAMTEMLDGNLNYDRFFDACDQKGIAWHFVEQDICRMDSIASIRISRRNLIARYGEEKQ